MKNTLKTIGIGIVSGFLGAYFFTFLPNENPIVDVASHQSKQNDGQLIGLNDHKIVQSADMVKAAGVSTPCVVYIKTTSGSNQQGYTWFDFFFGNTDRSNKVISSGSGVIFSKDGYIVTNNHVIEDATEIEVIHNKRTYKAQIIGTDPSTDLALLKVNSNNLPHIRLSSSKEVRVGDWVLAVGNPFNLTSTVTAGIVSAKGRSINILEGQFPIEAFIQTDAAINPGNSGGALVNLDGDLIGINTAILSRTGSYTGYGFAVPSDIVAKVVSDLKEHGQVQKAFIGAEAVDINEEIFKSLELDNSSGVVLNEIEKNGAAEKAGLKRGDIILKINGILVDSRSNFDEQLSYYKPGDKVAVEYKRGNKIKSVEVELTNAEGTTEILRKEVYQATNIGAELEAVSKVERGKLGIENGIRITRITGGLMSRLGLEEGFIILGINNKPIETPDELAMILEKIQGRVIITGINKKGERRYYSYYF
jgi:serine protease Do